VSNEIIFVKYLRFRKYIIFSSLIILIFSSVFRLYTEELSYGFKLAQNLSVFLILFTLFFETFESPFYLKISNTKNGVIIETFFPNFKKNVIFKPQNIKILKVPNNHKLHVTAHKCILSLKKYIVLTVIDNKGREVVFKPLNTRWLGLGGVAQIYDIVECHNFANDNSDSDEI